MARQLADGPTGSPAFWVSGPVVGPGNVGGDLVEEALAVIEKMSDVTVEQVLRDLLELFEDESPMRSYYDSHFVAETPEARREQLRSIARKLGDQLTLIGG